MKGAGEPPVAPAAVKPPPASSYADLLTAMQARRSAADEVLLRKMMQPRDPMTPP
jgi:hypothetical protein